jgi:hypothetical protein
MTDRTPNWDQLIADADWGATSGTSFAGASSEAEIGPYTLVKMFNDGDEIWIYEWVHNVPKLRAQIVTHQQP